MLKFLPGQMCWLYMTTRSKQPPWRNWLARSAVNRKVGGSSPPGGGFLLPIFGYRVRQAPGLKKKLSRPWQDSNLQSSDP